MFIPAFSSSRKGRKKAKGPKRPHVQRITLSGLEKEGRSVACCTAVLSRLGLKFTKNKEHMLLRDSGGVKTIEGPEEKHGTRGFMEFLLGTEEKSLQVTRLARAA